MSWVVTVYLEFDDESKCGAVVTQLQGTVDPAAVSVQEHVPYVSEDVPADETPDGLTAEVG